MFGLIAASLAVAAASPGDASIAGWRLSRRGPICAIEAASERETYLKIEFDPASASYFISVSSPSWDHVTDRGKYQLGFEVEGKTQRRVIPATGVRDEGTRALVIFRMPSRASRTEAAMPIRALRYGTGLRLDLNGEYPLRVDTGGLRTALVALRSCILDYQQRQNPTVGSVGPSPTG